jgi:hypothetical protein
MPDVVRYGSNPDTPEDIRNIERAIGNEADLAAVASMPNDRIRSSLALWLAGATYPEIASQLQMRSGAVAQAAVERALAESLDETTDRGKLRLKQSLRLDRFLKAISPKALNPDHPEQLQAMRTALAIVDRQIRLQGVDAPQEHIIHTPDSDEFARVITLAARGAGVELPETVDPWDDQYIEDAEVVEDDEEAAS